MGKRVKYTKVKHPGRVKKRQLFLFTLKIGDILGPLVKSAFEQESAMWREYMMVMNGL